VSAKKGLQHLDWLIEALGKPDTWTFIFAGIGTAGASAGVYLAKKFGWKLIISFKPAPPSIGPAEVNELIEKKLQETSQLKDYESLKENHFQLKALFDVSKSQWEEQILETKMENEQLKAEVGKFRAASAKSERPE
jgi:NADH/NAD ratio-sensing transcriptional regulator Rex